MRRRGLLASVRLHLGGSRSLPGSGGCSFLDLYTPHGDMCVDPIPWWREGDSAPLEKSWGALQHPSSRRASNPEHLIVKTI